MARNPLQLTAVDAHGAKLALAELKQQLILYVDGAPKASDVRRVYDLYMSRYGSSVDAYRSTAPGSQPDDWDAATRTHFESTELPLLYVGPDWGYVFGSMNPTDARLMMFHGARPVSQAGWASVYRFDFEWDFPAAELLQLTLDVLGEVECAWGSAGYGLYVDEGEDPTRADNKALAWAMRYWGAELRDLDAMMPHALGGMACVNWLTVVGQQLRGSADAACRGAAAVGHAAFDVGGQLVFQVEDRPRLIDRNRRETLGGYATVAQALLPLQLTGPVEFGGDQWDDDLTMRYLRRFTHPGDL
jgi:hypothetical protein